MCVCAVTMVALKTIGWGNGQLRVPGLPQGEVDW